jgi:hypothetical protein
MLGNILLPLIFMIFANLVNFKCFLRLGQKQPYKHCKWLSMQNNNGRCVWWATHVLMMNGTY